MLSLTEKVENRVTINGETYTVDTSFDNVLSLRELLEDDLPSAVKVSTGLRMLLKRSIKLRLDEMTELLNQIMKDFIYDDAKDEAPVDLEGNPMPMAKAPEYFSFHYDADLIYAAFMQVYQIDLEEQQGKLEWKKFKALLAGLPGNTRFSEIIDIRKRPYPKGKGSGKERTELMRLKKELSYPGVDFSEIGGD